MRLLLLFLSLVMFSTAGFAREMAPMDTFAPQEKQDALRADCFQKLYSGQPTSPECRPLLNTREINYCAKQPNIANSIKNISTFYYAAEKCMIKTLPLGCLNGYILKDAETPDARCVSAKEIMEETGPITVKYGNQYCHLSSRACSNWVSKNFAEGQRIKCGAPTYFGYNDPAKNMPKGCFIKDVRVANMNDYFIVTSSPKAIKPYCYGTGIRYKDDQCIHIDESISISCKAGQVFNLAVKQCLDCTPGSYSAAGAQGSCTRCDPGMFAPKSGSTSCQKCPEGTYSGAGAMKCSTCPVSQILNKTQTGCTKITCETGHILNLKTGKCDRTNACLKQPSLTGASKTSTDAFFDTTKKCWVTEYATACQAGFVLEGAKTSDVKCVIPVKYGNENCSPSYKNCSKWVTKSFELNAQLLCSGSTFGADPAKHMRKGCFIDGVRVANEMGRFTVQLKSKPVETICSGSTFIAENGQCIHKDEATSKDDPIAPADTTPPLSERKIICKIDQYMDNGKCVSCQEGSVLNSTKNGCISTSCKTGYVFSAKLGKCERLPACAGEQPSTTNATKTSTTPFFYKTEECWVTTPYPTACTEPGFVLKDSGTNVARCAKNAGCKTQPSTTYSTSVKRDIYYAKDNCWISAMPTACKAGYEVHNPDTPTATCTQMRKCAKQPSMANATTSIKDFHYGGGQCFINELPTACKTGYSLQNANRDTAACVQNPVKPVSKAATKCLTTAPTRNTEGVRAVRTNEVVNGCTTNKIIGCDVGYTLDEEKNTCAKIICPAGKYLKDGSNVCSTCLSGTYSKEGATSCSKCSAGTYATSGSSSCSKCPAGKYLPEGKNTCFTCEKGTYSKEGAYRRCERCPAGTESNDARTACVKVATCATQPSTANAKKTSSDVFYAGGKCTIKTLPTECNVGYSLMHAGTPKAACSKLPNCTTQPSTANSATTTADFYYAGGKCWISKLPRTCKEGFSLQNGGTNKAACVKAADCATQPSTANATKTSSDFYYAAGKCTIKTLPTVCKAGYNLQNPNTNKAACGKVAACKPQPSTANAKTTADDDFFSNGCWVTGKYATACNEGFALKDAKTSKARCEKTASCAKQPSVKDADKTETDVYYKAGKCWLDKMPTTCKETFALKDAGKDTARCEKIPYCTTKPSVANAKKTEKDVYVEKDNCLLPEAPVSCNEGFRLKYQNTNKARCEASRVCSGKPSERNAKDFIENFFYEKKNCVVTKMPSKCEKGYTMKHAKSDRAACSKDTKKSRRN